MEMYRNPAFLYLFKFVRTYVELPRIRNIISENIITRGLQPLVMSPFICLSVCLSVCFFFFLSFRNFISDVDLPSQKYLVLFDLNDDLSLVGLESYLSLVGLGVIMTGHYK